ncbi:MAG TPA: sce7726 family protein [Gemmatimonadaceae bacterium]
MAPPALDDAAIRRALLAHLHQVHAGDADTLVLEELGLCEGNARVDVAVVNGALAGYEIKSDCDTFDRLPRQRRVYGRVLDSVTIVVGQTHLKRARRRVPAWWGIMVAAPRITSGTPSDVVELEEVRPTTPNPAPEEYALAQFLWREEALAALRARGFARGFARAPRRQLWRRLAETVPLDELRALVRSTLKGRGATWRAGPPSP